MIIYACPECNSDLVVENYPTHPPTQIFRCEKCGWLVKEKKEPTREPYSDTKGAISSKVLDDIIEEIKNYTPYIPDGVAVTYNVETVKRDILEMINKHYNGGLRYEKNQDSGY